MLYLTGGNNDDNKENDDARDYTHSHLHILPPHLLAYSVGTSAEALGGYGKVVGLILKGIETLATLGHLVDVLSHYTNGVIDLLQKEVSSCRIARLSRPRYFQVACTLHRLRCHRTADIYHHAWPTSKSTSEQQSCCIRGSTM